MKKLITIILTLSMIFGCTVLYSCGNVDAVNTEEPGDIYLSPYTLYSSSADSSEGAAGLSLQTEQFPEEWTASRGKYKDEQAPKSVTVEIQGKKYTYQYTESYEHNLMFCPTKRQAIHIYGIEGSVDGYAKVDAQTSKIVSWYEGTPFPIGFWQIDTNNEADLAKLKETAGGYLEGLVGKERINDYQFTIDYNRIYFYRYINGKKTNEYVSMSLLANGSLQSYNLYNIGLYDDVTDFKFDEEKAETMIKTQIKEHFKDTKYSIEKMDITIRILPNGQMAYKYAVTVHYCIGEEQDENGEMRYTWTGETLTFTIPAE
ncbi:MAG: hypothetical protein E7599_00010 [Ruminococcaceae bacterium]|nr:hypothetical protein [Oscillospiraceae bacterium]